VATPRFDAACALAIGHLTRVAPMGMWAITRVVNGQQLMLAIDAPAYDVVTGAHFPYADSLCRFMVSGSAPQVVVAKAFIRTTKGGRSKIVLVVPGNTAKRLAHQRSLKLMLRLFVRNSANKAATVLTAFSLRH